MKKIVLNFICSILAIKEIAVSEKGEATLTEDQLNKLENELKAKDDMIVTLKAEKKTAEDAKATAEKSLVNLQTQFDNFKAEAGADTGSKPAGEEGSHAPKTAKDMYNGIKNLL